jgi:hypothetical protein
MLLQQQQQQQQRQQQSHLKMMFCRCLAHTTWLGNLRRFCLPSGAWQSQHVCCPPQAIPDNGIVK